MDYASELIKSTFEVSRHIDLAAPPCLLVLLISCNLQVTLWSGIAIACLLNLALSQASPETPIGKFYLRPSLAHHVGVCASCFSFGIYSPVLMLQSAAQVVQNPNAEGSCGCGSSFNPKKACRRLDQVPVRVKEGFM